MIGSPKVLARDELKRRVDVCRAAGRRVALANGLFDLLHVGHLRYLEAARREADLLVVAVNSDESARALRGPSRPIVPALERAELLAAFDCVDYVTIFEETTVVPVLRDLRPDVHCKGTDYTTESVPEAGAARELGIRVAIVGDPKRHATTDLLERIRSTQS